MNEMDGVDLHDWIKNHNIKNNTNTRSIGITSILGGDLLDKARRHGFTNILPKPTEEAAFLDAVVDQWD